MWFVLHAPFPAVGFVSYYLFFYRRIPSWIPPFLPYRPYFGHSAATFFPPLVEMGCLFFRCVFFVVFWTFLGDFLTSFWGHFYTFFAYVFELCFCLLFVRISYKCMCIFKPLDLQKHCFSRVKTLF